MSGSHLPNADSAMVAIAKIRNYLLDASHPGSGGKADFFASFGFTAENWAELRSALQQHPRLHVVVKVSVSDCNVICEMPSRKVTVFQCTWPARQTIGTVVPRNSACISATSG